MAELLDSAGLAVIVDQDESLNIVVALTDFDGDAIDAGTALTITLTLKDQNGDIINSVNGTDVQNANHGTIAGGILTLRLQAADNPLIDYSLLVGCTEKHTATVTWTWNDGVEVRTGVEHITFQVRKAL